MVLFLIFSQAVYATTFKQALSLALENSAMLKASQAKYNVIRQNQYIVLSESLPTVTAFTEMKETKKKRTALNESADVSPLGSQPSYQSDYWGIQADMVLFSGGQNFYNFRKTLSNTKSQQIEIENTKQTVLLNATMVYLNVLRDEAILNLHKENLVILEGQYQNIQNKFDVGLSTRTDVAQSHYHFKKAESSLIQQVSVLASSKALYYEVIGIEPTKLVATVVLPPIPETLDSAINMSLSDNFLIKIMKEASRSIQYQSYSAIGSVLPKITLSARYQMRNDPNIQPNFEEEERSISLNASMPLFMGGRNLAVIRAAAYEKDNQRFQIYVLYEQVRRMTTIAWHNFTTIQARIEASKQQIIATKIALESVKQEYEVGIKVLLDVLDARQELLTAQVSLISLKNSEHIMAYDLLSTMGHLTPLNIGIK